MLIVSRNHGQTLTVIVGDSVMRIKIHEVQGRKVRLAIDAPPEFVISRREDAGERPADTQQPAR